MLGSIKYMTLFFDFLVHDPIVTVTPDPRVGSSDCDDDESEISGSKVSASSD